MAIRSVTMLLLLASLAAAPATQPTKPLEQIGVIDHPPITEASGLVASRQYPGVYWTHCDSGNDPVIYAISREGKFIGEFPISAKNHDWEDIAIDEHNRLYVADIGNNGSKRDKLKVYQFDEPDPHSKVKKVKVRQTWDLRYADGGFDAESFFVWKGYGYIISKTFTGLPATMVRFALDDSKPDQVLEKVGSLAIHSPCTAADISPDGSKLAVLSVVGLHVFKIDGDPAKACKTKPVYSRLLNPRIEGCCFDPAGGILVCAETRELFLFADPTEPKQ